MKKKWAVILSSIACVGVGAAATVSSIQQQDNKTNSQNTTCKSSDGLDTRQAFDLGHKSWTKARLDDAEFTTSDNLSHFDYNFIVQKDIYLIQYDNSFASGWRKDSWASLREAALGDSKISTDGRPLLTNIKFGLGTINSSNLLEFGSVYYKNCVPLEQFWNNITQPTYAINDDLWDKNNSNEDLTNSLAGNSFTWKTDEFYPNIFTSKFHAHFSMNYKIDDGKSIFDIVQVMKDSSGIYNLRIDPSNDFTFRLSVTLNTHYDGYWDEPHTWNDFYSGDDTTAEKPITDLLNSTNTSQAQQIAGMVNSKLLITDDEKNYFYNNQQAVKEIIPLDEKHLSFQRFDGEYVKNRPQGDDLLTFLQTNKATVSCSGSLFDKPQDPEIDLSGYDSKGEPALLIIYNSDGGYQVGNYSSINIQLFGQDVGWKFGYWH